MLTPGQTYLPLSSGASGLTADRHRRSIGGASVVKNRSSEESHDRHDPMVAPGAGIGIQILPLRHPYAEHAWGSGDSKSEVEDYVERQPCRLAPSADCLGHENNLVVIVVSILFMFTHNCLSRDRQQGHRGFGARASCSLSQNVEVDHLAGCQPKPP